MYQFLSEISSGLSSVFFTLSNQWAGYPILAALLLGLVGAVAPCQFTGNIGAITIYGYRSFQKNIPWSHIISFVVGKLVVFSFLGFLVWVLGKEFHASFTSVIPGFRKAIGPLIIVMGIFLLEIFQMKWTLKLWEIPKKYLTDSKFGSFLMGVSFTLAFCPTMFILFFMTLMPIVLSTSYGAILPPIFGIGTSIPFLFSIFLIWYFELGGKFLRQGKRFGSIVQKTAGFLLIILGILDTLTYW